MRRRRSTPTPASAATTTAGSSLAALVLLAAPAVAEEEVPDIRKLGAVPSAVVVFPPYGAEKRRIVVVRVRRDGESIDLGYEEAVSGR